MSNDCNWRLEAMSSAAKNRRKTAFVLKAGDNYVGKQKDSHIKIPSLLCSREHCTIHLDGDNVTITDTSRNGTYITFSGDIGIKKYIGSTTEQSLAENDMISFGFNTATVYDVNDKNAFIYRLVKEQIETINLSDSDEDDAEPAPPAARIIDIADRVIDIDSDSDSNYSGDECLQNIEELKQEDDSNSVSDSDIDSENDSEVESIYSDDEGDEDDDADFVVTKTILKCATPTETIALDEDDDDDDDDYDDVVPEVSEEEEQSNGNEKADEPKTEESKESEEQQPETSKAQDERSRLEEVKKRIASKAPKMIAMTKPQPLRKRRKTITEHEYHEQKQAKLSNAECKKLQRERLHKLGEEAKAKREAAAENAPETNRAQFVPKVKNSVVTRGEQLATDFLALNK